MLTNAAVKAARPRAAAYKLADGGGLILHVAPTGLKSWRWRFRWEGREQLLTIGSYPEVSLDTARTARDQARARLDRGEDPRAAATSAAPTTFEPAARAWHGRRSADWTPVHAHDVIRSLERDIFPLLGATPLADIRPPLVLQLLRAIEARDSLATAARVRQRVEGVFAYACSEGWCDANPAAGVAEAMARGRAARHHPAIVDAGDLRELLAAVELVDAAAIVKLASRFLALTAVRIAAVRLARWSEIEDLDGAAPIWRVPAANVKLAAAKKLDPANDHVVPLSPAAVEVLRAARANMHPDDANMHTQRLIFPGRGGDAPIGENAVRDLYERAGVLHRHKPHGWRASFSTILNERLPGDRHAIDRTLGHVAGGGRGADVVMSKVEAAYNRAAHLAERRRLLTTWSEILDGVDEDAAKPTIAA